VRKNGYEVSKLSDDQPPASQISSSHWPRALAAADSARARAQSGFTVASAIATALVAAGIFTDITDRANPARWVGAAALSLWLAAMLLFLLAVSTGTTEAATTSAQSNEQWAVGLVAGCRSGAPGRRAPVASCRGCDDRRGQCHGSDALPRGDITRGRSRHRAARTHGQRSWRLEPCLRPGNRLLGLVAGGKSGSVSAGRTMLSSRGRALRSGRQRATNLSTCPTVTTATSVNRAARRSVDGWRRSSSVTLGVMPRTPSSISCHLCGSRWRTDKQRALS
jgi:hypothetical protein